MKELIAPLLCGAGGICILISLPIRDVTLFIIGMSMFALGGILRAWEEK